MASERRLLAELCGAAERLACGSDALPELSRPLRVVVPSQSLRLHLASRLVEAHGRPLLGLRLQTLTGAALEILERAGVALPEPALFPILVRREARREPLLVEGLEPLLDGYGSVVAAVDDLLDAGFEPPHADALEEQLELQPGTPGPIQRAQAVARVAARVAAALEREGVGHRSRCMVLAREWLERDPALLPCRGLFVHGFADATGVQADLIGALLQLDASRLLLPSPPDPASTEPRLAGPRFGAAFRERFEGFVPPQADASPSESEVVVLRAPGRMAEVRAVAERLRARLDAGAVPERLAVVARDLGPYRVALRVQLRRLGVPFSGVDEPGAATAVRRRLDALLALIEPGEAPALEPWLAACVSSEPAVRTADLRHAFHRRGALRLEDIEHFAGWRSDERLPLEVRSGLLPAEDDRPARAARRSVPGQTLLTAGRRARRLLRRLRDRPQQAPIARHVEWLESLAADALKWDRTGPEWQALAAATAALPAAPAVDADEFAWLVRRRLSGEGFSALGGGGGGVQLLSVMEARNRSFDALFLLGLSRGSFPRTLRQDPLLSDPVRARLRELLPALPVKSEGSDEERFLFAQLLSAADAVTCCWSETNDAGRPQPRSPLLDGLERGGRRVVHEVAAPLHAPRPEAEALPGAERALLAGLHGGREGHAEAFSAALAELSPQLPGRSAEALAASRLAVLDEIDAGPARQRLGPYFGFVGDVRDPADPRRAPLFITRLEDVARCPWQGFLRRLLRLAPTPDAAHQLPAADDRLLIGNVVHGVLERIVHRAREAGPAAQAGDPLRSEPQAGDPLRREAQPVPWPDEATLDALLRACAAEQLRDASNPVPGYDRVLARRARPFLEVARACDWSEVPPAVVGTELQYVAQVQDRAGRARELAFRADRVDRTPDGLLLTDYKTGKAIASQKRAAARSEQLREKIASGRALQAMLYARAGGPGARGRYLFLSEKTPEEARSLEAVDEGQHAEAFDAALGTLLEAWDRGSFLPRLREADRDEEPGACRFCDVKEACLRGDSGARLRLERWFEGTDAQASQGSAAEQAAAAVFSIGVDA